MATAIATLAASGDPPSTVTALERHASFFDPGGTGVITVRQTYVGMRRLGISLVWRLLLTPVINIFLGSLTRGRPSLVIRIDRIAQGKHPYDSGSFDDAGQFDASAFRTLFDGDERAITAAEMNGAITARGNRRPQMGRIAARLGHWFSGREVAVLFCVAADTTKAVGGRQVPALTAATLGAFYDGTLFHRLARSRALVAAGCVRARVTLR